MPDITTSQAMQMALAHHRAGRLAEAEGIYRQVLAMQPRNPEALHLLGVLTHVRGDSERGIALLREAVAVAPDYADAYSNLARVLTDVSRYEESIAASMQAISLRPDVANAHNTLGVALKAVGRTSEAVAAFRQALSLNPDHFNAYGNLGNALLEKGQVEEAFDCYRRALDLNLNSAVAHSNMIYAMLFDPRADAASMRAEQRRWNQRHALPLRDPTPHANDRDPDRRLKIGYVSPDFRDHVVGRNILPLLREHDHANFEIICYAGVQNPDALTAQMKSYADGWRNILGLRDDQVAQLVRQDQIDVLVDLTLHMNGSRLLVFARQPAPVQVTFAGYPGSTGLEAIQYRLTDPHLEPPGGDDTFWSETPVRLPHSFWCFDPQTEEPAPGPLPALTAGHITFGCLNNFAKVSDGALRLWAAVMRQIADSRLLLLSADTDHRQRTLEILGHEGIAAERIELVTPRPRPEYLALYQRIDIALDTLPYGGHTTSLDAFWMGVPVPTLVGSLPISRAGLTFAMNLQLPELIAHDRDEYVRKVVELCGNLPMLAELRAGLRERMRQSPLMDARGFTREIEQAYRMMWREWLTPSPR